MESRLKPINAVLDLAQADGLNPAPLAAAGWRVKALEVPVQTTSGVWVCDVALFNEVTGHLLGVEGKSGANIEAAQARKVASVDPLTMILAAAITVPRAVTLRYEGLYVCLEEHSDRIVQGLTVEGLTIPVMSVGVRSVRLVDPSLATEELASALAEGVELSYPIAEIVRFDDQSPDEAFDQPVRAELTALMASQRTSITIRALTEQVVDQFAINGQRARQTLVRKVDNAARRAAEAEPERLRYERRTGSTEARVTILRSPEDFDRRGRTQGYQALFGKKASRSRRSADGSPDQGALSAELDEAERVAIKEVGEDLSAGSSEMDDELHEPKDSDPDVPPNLSSDAGMEARDK